MDEKLTVCKECGIENEEGYLYCKNCGAELIKPKDEQETFEDEQQKEQPSDNVNFSHNNKEYSKKDFVVDTLCGVPTDEVADFVGKKSRNIIPKFSQMELTGSKTSWCWPVAILGFLFGPLGAGIWFCYRKMYKIGLILLAVGVILSCGFSLVAGQDVDAMFKENLEIALQEEDFSAVMQLLSTPSGIKNAIAETAENAVNLVTCVVFGIFAYNIYKKFAIKKIGEYRCRGTDPRYYRIGLAAFGGTSVGMAALGIVLFVFAQIISEYAVLLIK